MAYIYIYKLFIILCVCACTPQCTCGYKKTTLKSQFFFFFYYFLNVFGCLSECVSMLGALRGQKIPWDWNHRLKAVWVLGSEPSFSGKAGSALDS